MYRITVSKVSGYYNRTPEIEIFDLATGERLTKKRVKFFNRLLSNDMSWGNYYSCIMVYINGNLAYGFHRINESRKDSTCTTGRIVYQKVHDDGVTNVYKREFVQEWI